MTKGKKIEGIAQIIDRGTTQQKGCSLETPFLTLMIDGARYRWISENAVDFAFSSIPAIRISAYARENGHLYRVHADDLAQ